MLGKLFQSPLHRGNHFNEPPLETERLSLMISVPSSSGKSLQLSFFYPRAPSRNISIPSSSGKSLQRRLLHRLTCQVEDFSPLFIGEITSTTSTPSEDSLKSSFQSPLHRGNHFNEGLIQQFDQDFAFQSHLHRGNHFNEGLIQQFDQDFAFQSPLHRGNHFNAMNRAELEAIRKHFSPLFIGEITSTSPASYCGGIGGRYFSP